MVSEPTKVENVKSCDKQQLAIQISRSKKLVSFDLRESEKVIWDESLNLLEDSEIFILDTGIMTNSTRNSFSMTNMKTAQGSVTKMGNRAKIKSKAIGTLKSTLYDKMAVRLLLGIFYYVEIVC